MTASTDPTRGHLLRCGPGESVDLARHRALGGFEALRKALAMSPDAVREEVKKGMDEKVAQGGWPHQAPSGYLNDRGTRSLVPDPERSALVRYAFERYATGTVSLSQLASELTERGFTSRSGAAVGASAGIIHTASRPRK